ncbi:hypothetical protein MRB53_020689 [Persea americana]|uniref:Uncharacterized protein n=1 Tax=Persea americana TaxID=3435 RepID=A0ACC2L1Z2_PERAE|nr:hypothetical protein MRB53_020689 [Persea americana]
MKALYGQSIRVRLDVSGLLLQRTQSKSQVIVLHQSVKLPANSTPLDIPSSPPQLRIFSSYLSFSFYEK